MCRRAAGAEHAGAGEGGVGGVGGVLESDLFKDSLELETCCRNLQNNKNHKRKMQGLTSDPGTPVGGCKYLTHFEGRS